VELEVDLIIPWGCGDGFSLLVDHTILNVIMDIPHGLGEKNCESLSIIFASVYSRRVSPNDPSNIKDLVEENR